MIQKYKGNPETPLAFVHLWATFSSWKYVTHVMRHAINLLTGFGRLLQRHLTESYKW